MICRVLRVPLPDPGDSHSGLPMIPDLQAQEAPVVNVKVKVGVSHAAVAQAGLGVDIAVG